MSQSKQPWEMTFKEFVADVEVRGGKLSQDRDTKKFFDDLPEKGKPGFSNLTYRNPYIEDLETPGVALYSDDGEKMGYVSFWKFKNGGAINRIYVATQFRRQGVATRLLNYIRRYHGVNQHSESLSYSGAKFAYMDYLRYAKKTGKRIPPHVLAQLDN